eukprot:SAG22_NODE_12843_length_427_cov_0.945122_1_plen_43_part_10
MLPGGEDGVALDPPGNYHCGAVGAGWLSGWQLWSRLPSRAYPR